MVIENESNVVGVHELAQRFRCSERQIQLLVAQGMPKLAFGKYDLSVCRAWHKARKGVKNPWLSAQKRILRYRASREIRLAIHRELLALPTRVAPRLVGRSRAEIVAELRSAVKAAITALPNGATLQQEESQ